MLFGTVLLWALNITVTKYMFDHGWLPLAYGTIRYFAAIALFWIFTYRRERSFRIARADMRFVLLAAAFIFLNQVCFVYGVKLANASTVALLLGATPVFIGLISVVLGLERLPAAFWIGGARHVRRRRARRGGSRRRPRQLARRGPDRNRDRLHVGGVHGLDPAADAPLLAVPDQRARARDRLGAARRARSRLGTARGRVVLVRLEGLARLRVRRRRAAFPHEHPLVHGDRPCRRRSRASLFANMQPFFAVFFALVLLGESLHTLEIAGGVLIFAGIAYERVWRRTPDPLPTAE